MNERLEKPLSEIGCSFLSGYAFKSSDYSNTGIPLIKIGNIQNSIVTIDTNGDYVSEELVNDKTKKFILNHNDVLIAMTGQGSVGRVGKLKLINRENAFLNQRVGKFLCDEKNINIEYLYYILTTDKFQDYLFNTGAGSGQPNLSPELILQTQIPWVPYPKQIAIASVLSSFDDKIDLLLRQNKTLEQIAETLFRQWFVEEVKEDWEEVYLGDVIDTTSGGTPSRKILNYFQDGVCDWVKSKELSGSFIMETEEKITEEALKNSSAKILPKHSILIAMYGATVGEYAIIAKEMTCNQAICALKPNENYPYTFLFMLIKTSKDELINMAVGSAQQNISQQLIKQILIPAPNKRILEFHNITEPVFEKIKRNIQQVSILEKLRDTLLPKLMSGSVRVKMEHLEEIS